MPKVNPSFLDGVLARKRAEVAEGKSREDAVRLRTRAAELPPARPWAAALRAGTVAVIAEFKRRSPSAGPLAAAADVGARVQAYAAGGAAAVSVLTDAAFDGALGDLREAREAVPLPILRKDFLVDPWQVWESRCAGADAALVILAAVDDEALRGITAAAREAGMGLLIEAHRPEEAERLGPDAELVVGVNARDLETLEVSLDGGLAALATLRRRRGPDATLVAESGIRTRADVARAAAAGADAVLVGEHLMRAADPAEAVAGLVGSPRSDHERGPAARPDSS